MFKSEILIAIDDDINIRKSLYLFYLFQLYIYKKGEPKQNNISK